MSNGQQREVRPVGGRVPPNDLDAEAYVLSELMLRDESFDEVPYLRPEHFYSDPNRRIMESIVALHTDGNKSDMVAVATWLRDHNRLHQVGGTPYLAQLTNTTPTLGNVVQHAKTVTEKWRLRRTIQACHRFAAEGYGDCGDVQVFVEEAENELARIAHMEQRVTLEQVGEIMARNLPSMEEAKERRGEVIGIPTGYVELDRKTGGLYDGDLIIIAGRPGMGKGLAHSTDVLTPTGWRQCGDLKAGSYVIGANGQATRVLGVYELGEKPMYEVVLSDSAHVEVSGDHLWLTRDRSERRRGLPGSVRSTDEIRASLQRGKSGGLNHSIPYVQPVRFRSRKQLPIEPYLLGVWLADGVKRKPVIANPEDYIARSVANYKPKGDRSRVVPDRRGGCPTINITGGRFRKALHRLRLFDTGSPERFIPERYLLASVWDRLRLLQGLCDADGYVCDPHGKGIEYSTTSVELRDGIIELARSLGGRATWTKKRGAYRDKLDERVECRFYYRIVLSFPNGDILPVTSPKHLRKWVLGPSRVRERFIERVEYKRKAPCRCIKVAAKDGLFVTEDYIVTHNTAFATNLAINISKPPRDVDDAPVESLSEGVAFFSLEMPRDQIAKRVACNIGKVDVAKVRQNRLDGTDWSAIIGAVNEMQHYPFWVDDTPAISLLELRSRVRKLKREIETGRTKVRCKRLGLVVVDYLQLMQGERRQGDNREREVSSLSAGLKRLAKEEGIPVCALSQLNRGVEKSLKKDKRPTLADLRESGAIEQDADVVIFLYRPSYYDKGEPKLDCEVIVAKQRNGPTGTVELRFEHESLRFYSGDRAYDEVDFDQFDDFS